MARISIDQIRVDVDHHRRTFRYGRCRDVIYHARYVVRIVVRRRQTVACTVLLHVLVERDLQGSGGCPVLYAMISYSVMCSIA